MGMLSRVTFEFSKVAESLYTFCEVPIHLQLSFMNDIHRDTTA